MSEEMSLEAFDDETENRSNTHAPLQVQGFAMISAWDGGGVGDGDLVWMKPDLLFSLSVEAPVSGQSEDGPT
jgi:hypothetical protein